MILAASCGQRQSDTTVEGTPAATRNQLTDETITKDILSLPEMQFPNAAVMIVDEPTDDEPWFTVRAGSNMDDHFATSFWFRVYTAPEYEIKIYDVALDSEMTLAEWRSSKPMLDDDFSVIYDDLPELGTHIERAFSKDGKWGLVEPGDKIIVPALYDGIGVFKGDYDANNDFTGDGLAAVKRDGKWGFINRKNELVVPFKYDSAKQDAWGSAFHGEAALVERDGESFWLDINGREISR